jgi:hypothetical protein
MTVNPGTTAIRPRPVDALFPEAAAARRSGVCPKCWEAVDPGEFTDDLSRADFAITGLCNGCQIVVYQSEDE